jgi:hypothetical protein
LASKLRRAYDDDFFFHKRLRFNLRRRCEPADDAELSTMGAQRVHRLRRGPGHDPHPHPRMRTLECCDDVRQKVGGRDA